MAEGSDDLTRLPFNPALIKHNADMQFREIKIYKSYTSIASLLKLIYEPNQEPCQRLYKDNEKLFREAQGSSFLHQAWPGGYHDHVEETMNYAVVSYELDRALRYSMPFTLSDALLVLFLHDLEKPWLGKAELAKDSTKPTRRAFRKSKIEDYGIALTPMQENALRYVEGEGDDYSRDHRVMNELAAFVHTCDVKSARMWHNYPIEGAADAWKRLGPIDYTTGGRR